MLRILQKIHVERHQRIFLKISKIILLN